MKLLNPDNLITFCNTLVSIKRNPCYILLILILTSHQSFCNILNEIAPWHKSMDIFYRVSQKKCFRNLTAKYSSNLQNLCVYPHNYRLIMGGRHKNFEDWMNIEL
jgi:hypothetical protein